MKRQIQKTGKRKWFGDDFLALQNEIYDALEGLFAPYGNCIISGCAVTGNNIAAGIVYIGGKICRFSGGSTLAFPCYLVLNSAEIQNRLYNDGISKPTVNEYTAQLAANTPEGDYIVIESTGGKLFREALQDSNHRFVTDSQITSWSQNTAAQILANILMVDGHNSGLDADLLDGNQASAFALLSGATFTGLINAPGVNATITEKAASELPSTYPNGYSSFAISTTSDWSTGAIGSVITNKIGNAIVQYNIAGGESYGTIMMRMKKLSTDSWGDWVNISGVAKRNNTTTNRTIGVSDHNTVMKVSGGYTLTIPNGLPAGMKLDVFNVSTSTVIFSCAGTWLAKGTKLASQYGGASLFHEGNDIWSAVGDLTN